MRLSEMRGLLEDHGIRLTKSLGQNFLHDDNQLRRILAAANLHREDQVLEIGAGLGPLTAKLLEHAGKVVAIEKDQRLMKLLQVRFGTDSRVELIHADAVKWLRQQRRDWSGFKLVANLPYSVASLLLVDLALRPDRPEQIVVTLQAEVAKRLMARTGASDYGLLSLLMQLNYEPGASFKIPPGCFFPEPDVVSACVSLTRRRERLLPEELQGEFVRLVKCGFGQRRKMLFKLMKAHWPEERLRAAWAQLGLATGTRAEDVGLEEFVALAQYLSSS